ncbi:hypothetical protein TNCV_3478891 [Trichonephila clavipes]|nr:hypothetical protein TNCV_3478891 [Trichonephila clavipes]
MSRAQTSSRWCGVVVRRVGYLLRCRPRHLTLVQNFEVRRQNPRAAEQCDVNIHSLARTHLDFELLQTLQTRISLSKVVVSFSN